MRLNATAQRSVILKYLQAHGTMTTLEARNKLSIMHPASRILELRAQGQNISTVRIDRIAKYVLGVRGGRL